MLRRIRLEATVLSSNEILSDTDQQDLRYLLGDAEKDVESLKADIRRLQDTIGTLVERHAQRVDRIKRLRAIGFAPHKKLPPEIISQIFRWCGAIDVNRLPPNRYQSPAWEVSRVCARWRRIALAEPALWDRIHVPPHYALSPPIIRALSETFSTRGGNGIIEFHITPSCQEDWGMAHMLVSKYPSRLRKLQITIQALPANPAFFANMFNNLRSLTVSLVPLTTIITSQTPFKDLSAARDLHDVKVHCAAGTQHILSAQGGMVLPWTQLTDLTLSGIPMFDFSAILPKCTQLVSCNVSFGHDIHEIWQRPIILKHLQNLVIDLGKGASINALVELLITPALKSISFNGLAEWLQEEVLRLIDRSSCSIEVFEVADFVVPDSNVVPLLRAMPEVVEFAAFTSGPTLQETFDAIMKEDLAPKLRVLEGLEVTTLSPAFEFFRNRWDSPLRKGIYKATIWMKNENYHTGFEAM